MEFLSSDQGRAGYTQFFRELLDLPVGEAILFHCSAGKDRTGCAAMLILFALGADEETVMEDFLLTNEFNAALIEEDKRMLREEGIPEEDWDAYLPQMDQVSPVYMQNVLAWMTENYGSPLGYITQELDVTEEELNELRNKYLEYADDADSLKAYRMQRNICYVRDEGRTVANNAPGKLNGPIVVLMNQYTFSAAEDFIDVMKMYNNMYDR